MMPAQGNDALQDMIERLQTELHQLKDTDKPVGWRKYTPVWTASVTNPTLGNGSLTGRYRKVGVDVHLRIYLVAGSSTNFGSGSWNFSLPIAAYNDGLGAYLGQAVCRDEGIASYTRQAQVIPVLSKTLIGGFIEQSADSNNTTLTATHPFAWGSGDSLIVDIWYRVE